MKKLERELDKELQYFGTGPGVSFNFNDIFNSVDPIYQFQNENDRLYAEGLASLKRKVNSMVKTGSKEEYHEVLSEINNLVALAREETPHQKAMRNILKNMYIRRGADIKSKKDKKDMIEERIGHYEELQDYKVERELRKNIRRAHKDGDLELAKQLEEEWKTKYGDKKSQEFRRS